MKRLTIAIACLALATPAWSQKQEIGLTMGRLLANERNTVRSGGGVGLQANYGLRVWSNSSVAVYGEFHMLASPQRLVTSAGPAPTAGGRLGSVIFDSSRDYASLYLTPGIRVKLNPVGRIQPYGAIGGGLAWYENSMLTISGFPNAAPRELYRGALMFGGGADVPVKRWLALRGEIRDFYTGNPGYNVPVSGSGQHNVVAGGGFVLRFGR